MTTMLDVCGLGKAFNGNTVLDHIDLSVAAGSTTAVVGSSGCGKTTLLRLIAGFETPDAGTVTISGKQVARPDRSVAPHRRSVGYVAQDGALFPISPSGRTSPTACPAAHAAAKSATASPNCSKPFLWSSHSRLDDLTNCPVDSSSGLHSRVRWPGGPRSDAPRRTVQCARHRTAGFHPQGGRRVTRRNRSDDPAGDPRPGGGALDRRPDRGDAGGALHSGRCPAGRIPSAQRPLHRRVPW